MRREWKPGDVFSGRIAQRDRETFFVVEVTANSRAAWGDGLHAINADGNGYRVRDIADRRPVVGIDPEDREQVERLLSAILIHQPRELVTGDRNVWNGQFVDALTRALREFANPTPPKPEEPGIGGLVEDEGVEWAHLNTPKAPWHSLDGKGRWATWDDFSASVSVKAEGVTA